MKILITTDLFATKTNGVVTSITNLSEELRTMGHEVRILTLSPRSQSHVEDTVYYIASASLERIYPDLRMPLKRKHPYILEMIEWKPDVIHSQCEFFSFGFAKQVAYHTGAPIVHTYHTLYEQYVPYLFHNQMLGEALIRRITRRRLRRAAAIVAPSKKTEAALLRYRVSPKIYVVPSGIRLEKYKYIMPTCERTAMRSSLGIKAEDIVLLSLGRLGVEKSVDELIVLCSWECMDRDHLRLLIVGDGPERADLEGLVDHLNLRDRVIFTGMVPPTEVYRYYQAADVFVCASTSETQGLTYIEAIANGLPLLCQRDPCLNGVLMEGENGFSYDSCEEFTKHLQTMINNTQWREAATSKNEEVILNFSCEKFAEKILMLYTEVLQESTHRRRKRNGKLQNTAS